MQTENITKILDLQYNLFDLDDFKAVTDFIANDTYKIIQYQLAVIVNYNKSRPKKLDIINVSGTLDTSDKKISKDFELWLKKTIPGIIHK